MRRMFFICFSFFFLTSVRAQILFTEECFTGGITVGGHSTLGILLGGRFTMKWEEDYSLRRAYIATYRYGWPEPHSFALNGDSVKWDNSSQVGPELPEINELSDVFAVHILDVTNVIEINENNFHIDFPPQKIYTDNANWGWYAAYVIVLYESPDLDQPVCFRLYTADQSQDYPQNYCVPTPNFQEGTSVLFSIFSHRLAHFHGDASRITMNGHVLGDIWTGDLVTPQASSGVQGHFYYENGMAWGLNGDTANDHVHKQDGIAVVNDYLSDTGTDCYYLKYVSGLPIIFNPHPAFTLTYTPSCTVPESSVERNVTFCRGDTAQLTAAGYDHYEWKPGSGLSDSTIANPLCFADSSRWYRVRMWDDDGATCPQTIPVFVEVGDVPQPKSLEVKNTACPQNTGRITAMDTPGKKPVTYTLNGQTNTVGAFAKLAPGNYDLSIATAQGCVWDTAVTILLKPIQTAAFTPNPEGGYSPLEVFFQNESTGATSYQWLVDGAPIRNNENFRYNFAEPGTYEVMLLAFFGDSTCADTARYTLIVLPGLEIAVPNIITPNNDGKNDALVAQLSGVASIRWDVYNRWGNRLHGGEALAPDQSIEMWRPQPDEFPQGVYTVVISATGESGQVKDFVVQVMVK